MTPWQTPQVRQACRRDTAFMETSSRRHKNLRKESQYCNNCARRSWRTAMKLPSLIALGGLCVSASAIAAQAPVTVTGYGSDPLGVVAIQQGDLARAEATLTARRLDAGDPV